MKRYKAIIFDLGKVVFDYSFDRAFAYWASAAGCGIDRIEAAFSFDEIFAAFEKDEITPEMFRQHISEKAGINLNEKDFAKGWNNIYLELYPGINELLEQLKENYRLIALTNTNRVHAQRWKTKFAPTLNYFEKVFSSHEMNARKPEEEAYRIVLDYLGTAPSKVLFLDDNKKNIIAAENLGIKSIRVNSFEQMLTDMRSENITA